MNDALAYNINVTKALIHEKIKLKCATKPGMLRISFLPFFSFFLTLAKNIQKLQLSMHSLNIQFVCGSRGNVHE